MHSSSHENTKIVTNTEQPPTTIVIGNQQPYRRMVWNPLKRDAPQSWGKGEAATRW